MTFRNCLMISAKKNNRRLTRQCFFMMAVAAVCLLGAFSAARASSIEPIKSQKILLENGMTVVVAEMPNSGMVSIFGFVNVGVTMEGPFLGTGLSHFLEHMIFKGTPTRKPGDIPNEIQSLGGTVNASTGLDYTIFTITVPSISFSKGLDILSDMLMNAEIDEEEFVREKQVVLSEMGMYKDRPDRYLSELVFQNVYRVHPYRVPVIGYEDLLKALTAQEMAQHYKKFYAPNNMVLVITGGIEREVAFQAAEDAFKDFKRMPVQLHNLPPEPRQKGPRDAREFYHTSLTRMSLAYRGVNMFDADMAALDALAAILGQGESSRLYRELVQRKALVQSISALNFTPLDEGVFEIESSFMDVPVEQVTAAIAEQVARIQKSGVTEQELSKAKKAVWKEFWNNQETSESLAYDLAVSEGLLGDSLFSFRYAEHFQKLSPKDIQQAAVRYLREDGCTTVVLLPQDQEAAKDAVRQEAFDKDAIEVVRFENGMTILLRQNSSLPLVQAALVFNGGVGQENENNNGISNLFSDVWGQGTERLSAERLHEILDQDAISLNAFSGRNSVGLQMSVMSDDLPKGLDLLADIALHPVFPAEEIEKSRQRMHTAISARDDDLMHAAGRLFLEELFKGHPARLTELGTHESIDAISRKDLLAYYHSYVEPNNAVLAIFGNFNRDDVLKHLKSSFGKLKKREVEIIANTPELIVGAEEKQAYFDKQQAVVIVGAQAAGFYSEDRYGLEVLAAVLGSPFRGRVFHVIREQMGVSYRLGGGYQPVRDTGYMQFQVLTSPDRAQEVKEALHRLIAELREQPVDPDLLQSTKAYLTGNFRRTKESDSGFSFMVALDELYGLGWNTYQGYEQHIEAITSEDIERLAQKYLTDAQLVTFVALPEAEKSE